jgi:hypothetical protein
MIRRFATLIATALLGFSALSLAAGPTAVDSSTRAGMQANATAQMPSRVLQGRPPAAESFRARFEPVDVASLPAPEKAAEPAVDDSGRLRVASVRALPKAAAIPEWNEVPEGFVSTLRASSEGAKGLRVLLDIGRRAAPVEIRAVGADGRVESTIADPARGSEIWTPWTDGSSQVIELFSPAGAPLPAVEVASILHFDLSPFEKAAASSCTVSAACSVGDATLDNAIAERVKSSVRIIFVEGGSGFLCSATLINSDRYPIGFLLTANHCISTAAAASSVSSFWFYEPTSCADTTLKFGMVQLSGGATLTFSNYNADGTLLRMTETPPVGAVYSGWNGILVNDGEPVVSISHPHGDTTRLATGHVTREYRIDDRAQDEYGVAFDRGIIEGGSSGSGLFTLSGGNLELRGILTGSTVRNGSGGMTCTNLVEEALYGRFEVLYPQIAPYISGNGVPAADDAPNRVIDYNTVPLDPPLNNRSISLNRRIDPSGDVDVYRFSLSAAATVNVGTTGTLDTVGVLMDTNGKGIAGNDDAAGNSRTNFNFGITRSLAAGTYYVMVAHFDANGTGAYTFNMSATTDSAPSGDTGTNYSDLWWSTESGWGINIAHQGDVIFALLYTYDTGGQPMWLVMSNGDKQADGSYSGVLYRSTGQWFAAPGWTPNTTSAVGSMRINFTSATTATLTYTANGIGVTKNIQRFAFASPGTNCTFGTGSRAASTNYQDLWWNPSESGWGISIAHQGSTLFGLMYVYDTNGQGLWLSMSNGMQTGTRTFSGPLYASNGPAYYASPWTPATTVPIGNMTLAFSDGENGTLTYTVNGLQVVKQIKRFVYANPISICTAR